MSKHNDAKETLVVLIRHAQSEWNREGRFTGWADPPLTRLGRREAHTAAKAIDESGIVFGHAYSSRLARARETATILLDHQAGRSPGLVEDWRLNERHYGRLQGQNKRDTAASVGDEQVWRWRRGYGDTPPLVGTDDPAHPRHLAQWADLDPRDLPAGESLAQVRERVLSFWSEQIVPKIGSGETVLVASHGNTLRALLMALDGMTVEGVEAFEIPTGVPIVYSFSPTGRPLGWRYLDTPSSRAA